MNRASSSPGSLARVVPTRRQQTLAQPLSLEGVGVHRGEPAVATVHPAPQNHGIVFVRGDVGPHARVRASAHAVVDTRMCTSLAAQNGDTEIRVQTVEHLLSALYGMGIDNAVIHLSGPEVPIMDGSAAPMVSAIVQAGIASQHALATSARVTSMIEVQEGERRAVLLPPRAGQDAFEVECSLSFDHPLIPPTPYVYHHSVDAFQTRLSRARTFGFLKEVESLRRHGLALGGTLENAVVFGDDNVCSPGGLRYADECARHKVLDALGDLSLTGLHLCGRLVLTRSGHSLHVALARAVVDAWQAAAVDAPPVRAAAMYSA